MPLINRKNYIQIVCVIFTCLVVIKLLSEGILGIKDAYYTENLMMMLGVTVVATFILSLHYYVQNVPVLIVIGIQYILLIGLLMGVLWFCGYFGELHENGYKDMFWSVTIPYGIGAAIYYINFFVQLQQANKMLMDMKEKGRTTDGRE